MPYQAEKTTHEISAAIDKAKSTFFNRSPPEESNISKS
ncbi:hypothetical protein JCM19241_975 [Vibrio ishigakensis]|uniref:Uncharacterized protein n=1 Tax=Vibrio ishigakensis TaxID=1481914 RepID=A0A0B8QCG9_9VIBR|nr:hypothetical protein JCM19241_975 [Vibrio ishigakensis]